MWCCLRIWLKLGILESSIIKLPLGTVFTLRCSIHKQLRGFWKLAIFSNIRSFKVGMRCLRFYLVAQVSACLSSHLPLFCFPQPLGTVSLTKMNCRMDYGSSSLWMTNSCMPAMSAQFTLLTCKRPPARAVFNLFILSAVSCFLFVYVRISYRLQ